MQIETLLGRLAGLNTVVAETATLATIRELGATDVSLSASRLAAAALEPEHHDIVQAAVTHAQAEVGKGGVRRLVAMRAVERLPIEFAKRIAAIIDGLVMIELDGRLAHKRRATIDRARAVVAQLEEEGVSKDRVLLKVPATWEGIEAVAKLRDKSAISCCLTHVFDLHQLAAGADAGAAAIAPTVGRISDFHRKKDGVESYPVEADPGVLATLRMHRYLKDHGYASRLMPGTFRSAEQALAVASCELVVLPPKLLTLMVEHAGQMPAIPSVDTPEKLSLDKGGFAAAHTKSAVASQKLTAALRNLGFAATSQERQLGEWITKRQDEAAELSTLQLFKIWDYDGDGFIDREEWMGTPEVFNALDRDSNGLISLEEMAIGLGAPYSSDD